MTAPMLPDSSCAAFCPAGPLEDKLNTLIGHIAGGEHNPGGGMAHDIKVIMGELASIRRTVDRQEARHDALEDRVMQQEGTVRELRMLGTDHERRISKIEKQDGKLVDAVISEATRTGDAEREEAKAKREARSRLMTTVLLWVAGVGAFLNGLEGFKSAISAWFKAHVH